jgi:hypothetical protein
MITLYVYQKELCAKVSDNEIGPTIFLIKYKSNQSHYLTNKDIKIHER